MKRGRPKLYWLYFLMAGEDVIYIGVTRILKNRLLAHRRKGYTSVKAERISGKVNALNKERMCTILFQPKYAWIPNHLLNHPQLGLLKQIQT